MKFEELLHIVKDDIVFETGLLLAGDVNPNDVRKQLSRWVNSGRLVKFRRGLYMLGNAFRNKNPHPFRVANLLVPGSYVSCESALSFYHIIPEYTPQTISITAGRSCKYMLPEGGFTFHHIKPTLHFGYVKHKVNDQETVFIAEPEKALLDLIYLRPGADSLPFLKELRLNMDLVNMEKLNRFSEKGHSKKVKRAVNNLIILSAEQDEYKDL